MACLLVGRNGRRPVVSRGAAPHESQGNKSSECNETIAHGRSPLIPVDMGAWRACVALVSAMVIMKPSGQSVREAAHSPEKIPGGFNRRSRAVGMGPGYRRSLSRVQDRVLGEGGPRVSTPHFFRGCATREPLASGLRAV